MEVVAEHGDHVRAERLSSGQDFRDDAFGEAGIVVRLNLHHAFSFHQVAKEVGVGCLWNVMVPIHFLTENNRVDFDRTR